LITSVALRCSSYMSSTGQRANWISVYDGSVKIPPNLDRSIARGAVAFALCIAAAAQGARSAPIPDCGGLVGQTLRCTRLGYTYKVPFGWVDRTAQMQQAAVNQQPAPESPASTTSPEHRPAAATTGRVLLAVFEHPPEVGGGIVDPGVLIAAERAAEYPKVKTAADYFGPLADLAEQRGLKMEDGPYMFSVGAKRLVRGDFSGGTEKAPVRQSSLVVLEKGYIVSFTFVSGSDDEIDALIDNLTFTAGLRQKPPKQ
jgi:hypothetical protein